MTIGRDPPYGLGSADHAAQREEFPVDVERLRTLPHPRRSPESTLRRVRSVSRVALGSMPNIANSSTFQPQTMFSPKRPRPIWSAVTICFAANTGCSSGACTVPKTAPRSVAASRPRRPGQRFVGRALEIGFSAVALPTADRKQESPCPSRRRVLPCARLSSQSPDQRSGTRVAARPDEQFAPNKPSLSLLRLFIDNRSARVKALRRTG